MSRNVWYRPFDWLLVFLLLIGLCYIYQIIGNESVSINSVMIIAMNLQGRIVSLFDIRDK